MININNIISTNKDSHTSIIDSQNRKIVIDNNIYSIPKHIKCHCITQINGKIYIDGYEFKKGKFKRTLKALWHFFF